MGVSPNRQHAAEICGDCAWILAWPHFGQAGQPSCHWQVSAFLRRAHMAPPGGEHANLRHDPSRHPCRASWRPMASAASLLRYPMMAICQRSRPAQDDAVQAMQCQPPHWDRSWHGKRAAGPHGSTRRHYSELRTVIASISFLQGSTVSHPHCQPVRRVGPATPDPQ